MAELLEDQRAVEVPIAQNGTFRGMAREVGPMMAVTPRLVAYNFAYLALVWGVALGSIAVFWWHPAWYTFALAFLIVSSRQQALLNVEHEAIHGKLVPSKAWNVRIGRWLCAAPVGSPFGASRARHLSHHRLLGTPEDPDHDLHSGETKSTRGGLVRHFASGLVGGYAGMVLFGPPDRSASPDPAIRRRDFISLVIAQAVMFGLFTLVFAWWVYPLLWLLPLGTVTALAHLIRSFVEHAITDSERPGHANRLITISSNKLERFMVAPYGMNYHAEHHLVPSVPAPRLRALQDRIAEREDLPPVLTRSSYGETIRRFLKSLPK